MVATSLMAQELPILPVGVKFDFAASNFNQQDAVQLMAKRAKSARVILSGRTITIPNSILWLNIVFADDA